MVQEAFLRPIENTTSSITAGSTFNIDVGAYASILTLIRQIENADVGGTRYTDVSIIGSTYKVKFTMNGSQALNLGTPLYWQLGFASASYGAATTHTAEYVSPFIWLPTFHSNSIDGWHLKKNYFQGSMAVDGSRAGFDLGPTLYKNRFDFFGEPAANVHREFVTTSTPAVETELSLEQMGTYLEFFKRTKTVATQSSNTDNISVKGFYYVPNFDSIRTGLNSMDSGNINFDYASGADTYVFCGYDGEDVEQSVNTFGRGKVRYNVSIPAHTANAPTWLVDGTS
jgi:hypothetical protein